MKKSRIFLGGCSYISDYSDWGINGLPKGVIGKGLPDVGGTFCVLNSYNPYIVVVPTKDLLSSICADKNYREGVEVFRVDGSTRQYQFRNQDKIAVTYDSFKKLTSWLPNPNKYRILIDEYHLLLQSVGFREEAISSLFETLKLYNHYTFLTATPLDEKFEPKEIRELPHYQLIWEHTRTIYPIRLKCSRIQQTLIKIIKSFLGGDLYAPNNQGESTKVRELYIYLNSVTGIKQIIDTVGLTQEQVKICCATRNRNRLVLDRFEISDVTEPNKPINFFTSKCYQGCNLFTDNGLVIVVSDSTKESQVTDLSSDLMQIAGRIRSSSNNCFSNILIHLYNTNSDILSDREFESLMQEKIKVANVLIEGTNSASEEYRQEALKRMNLDNDVLTVKDNTLVFSELKEMFFRYSQNCKKQYLNGITVKDSYNKNIQPTKQEWRNDYETKLKKLTRINYRDLIEDYFTSFDSSYETEYPEFQDYRKYLTIGEIRTVDYSKTKLRKLVEDKKKIDSCLFKLIEKNGFYTYEYLKSGLSKLFALKNIEIKPKASLVEKSTFYSVEKSTQNGKKGYLIERQYRMI